jgi:hypothetical protein
MMRCADPDGDSLADDSAALARDVALCRMRRADVPWRMCAAVLNAPESTLRCRYARLHPAVRADYARTPLDFIGL